MRASGFAFLSVRLSMVVKPNTSSGSPSSSLSSGTSACWSTVNNGGQPEYRLQHLSWFEHHRGTHPDHTANVILLNDDVCHLWCVDMGLQEELFPNRTWARPGNTRIDRMSTISLKDTLTPVVEAFWCRCSRCQKWRELQSPPWPPETAIKCRDETHGRLTHVTKKCFLKLHIYFHSNNQGAYSKMCAPPAADWSLYFDLFPIAIT